MGNYVAAQKNMRSNPTKKEEIATKKSRDRTQEWDHITLLRFLNKKTRKYKPAHLAVTAAVQVESPAAEPWLPRRSVDRKPSQGHDRNPLGLESIMESPEFKDSWC